MSPIGALLRHQLVKVGLVFTHNFWTLWPIFKNEVPLDSLGQDEFNTTMTSISGYIDFPQFPVLLKAYSSYNFFPIFPRIGTHHRQSNPHSGITFILDFQNRLSGTASGNKATKQEVGSNLCKSLRCQHQTWYMSRGRHDNMLPCAKATSPKMVDIKLIEFIADAKIMLYTSDGQKVILWFNQKFIWRLLNVRWKILILNIWNMHAWLIARAFSPHPLSLCSSLRVLQIHTHTRGQSAWHARERGETHTHLRGFVNGGPSTHLHSLT